MELGPDGCRAGREGMKLDWILLGIVGWILCALFVSILMRMASDQDRSARHAQRDIDPYADVTITRSGRW